MLMDGAVALMGRSVTRVAKMRLSLQADTKYIDERVEKMNRRQETDSEKVRLSAKLPYDYTHIQCAAAFVAREAWLVLVCTRIGVCDELRRLTHSIRARTRRCNARCPKSWTL